MDWMDEIIQHKKDMRQADEKAEQVKFFQAHGFNFFRQTATEISEAINKFNEKVTAEQQVKPTIEGRELTLEKRGMPGSFAKILLDEQNQLIICDYTIIKPGGDDKFKKILEVRVATEKLVLVPQGKKEPVRGEDLLKFILSEFLASVL
jgi:hypothetical protein